MFRTALWLFCIGTLLGCAPQERTEAKTVLSAHRLPQRVCKWEPRVKASRDWSNLLVTVTQQRTCRFVEERQVRTDVSTHPNMPVFMLEAGVTLVGAAFIANAFICDAQEQEIKKTLGGRTGGCIEERLLGWAGVAIVIPAGTATIVDTFDFIGGESRVDVEYKPLEDGVEVYQERAVRGVTVTLELSDGRTLSSESDDLGIATLPLPAEARTGVLRVGKITRQVPLQEPRE
ncbi:MAG: hypothetical protein R3B13_19990 [Polyangiaceae bacterium]